MSLRRDERAVTVQIGAVLLLAIIFAALALYQVNAVPTENGAVESEHNQQVHGEMQELRNAVKNAGTKGDSTSVSVALGTRYPSRTFLTNPPNPTGTLETGESGTVRIDNANFEGTYTGDPGALLGTDYETRPIHYEPSYNEYRSAPTTRIEHGFAFNDFGEASVGLTKQPLIDDERITIVLVEGDLSTSLSSATTVDTRVLSGPTDPIDLESTGDNITITVPTQSPDAWNKTIGTEFGTESGQAKAKVTGYSAGELTIKLENDPNAEYELQMARIGVGDVSTPQDDPFDVHERTSSSASGSAYTVNWQDPSSESGADDDNCDSESCVVTGDTTLTMETNGVAAGASVDYAVSDPDIGSLSRYTGTTGGDGTDTTMFEIGDADDGETVTIYTSSGGSGNRIELHVQPSDGDSGPETDGISWAITDETTYNVVQYSVSYDVSVESFDHAQIEFHNRDRGTTTVENRSGPRGTVEYSEGGSGGDSYTITITAFDTDGDVIGTKSETDTADGTNPAANDDLSSPTGPRLDGSRVDDWSQHNDKSARYFVSYDVKNRNDFDRVEVRFKNRDSGAITTETATDPRGRLEFSGNSIGNEFGIELRVYDTDGVLVDSRSFTDTADGTNPTGNDDLATATSPQFQSVSVMDNGNNGQSRYTVDYAVDRSSNLETVWAEFRNLDNPWATEITEQSGANGQFVHEPGGGTGRNAYEITLLVFDSDGAVVDRWYDDNPG